MTSAGLAGAASRASLARVRCVFSSAICLTFAPAKTYGDWRLISESLTERGVHDLIYLLVVQYTPSKHEALSWLLPIYVGPMIGGYFITTAYLFRTIAAANRDFAERMFEWETAGPGRGSKYDLCLCLFSNAVNCKR